MIDSMASRPWRILAAIVLVAALPTTSLADTGSMHLVRPGDSTLTVVAVERDTGTSARFSGRAWVRGTFVARWPAGARHRSHASPEYLLIPDRAAIATLPYFYLREATHTNRYRVQQIELLDGADALRIVVGQARARTFLRRHGGRIDVVGSFLIGGYSVGVECDAPWARARLEKAEIPAGTTSRASEVPETC